MHKALSILCALTTLLSAVVASPVLQKRAFDRTNFHVTNLTVEVVESGTNNVYFELTHWTTKTNFSSPCTASWTGPSAEGVGIHCGYAEVSFESWNGPDDFGLYIKQTYEDPAYVVHVIQYCIANGAVVLASPIGSPSGLMVVPIHHRWPASVVRAIPRLQRPARSRVLQQ